MIATQFMTQKRNRIRTPRIRPGVRASVFVGADGRTHTFLNCALPTRTDGSMVAALEASICSVCGHGYTALMLTGDRTCAECRIEHAADMARVYEEAGIYLGWSWRVKAGEMQDIDRDYEREQHIRAATRSLMSHDA